MRTPAPCMLAALFVACASRPAGRPDAAPEAAPADVAPLDAAAPSRCDLATVASIETVATLDADDWGRF